MSAVELPDITMADLPLYEAMLTDPRMMSELGGPLASDELEKKLRGIVDDVETGSVWYSVIVTRDGSGASAGTVCIWDHDWNGETITEIGWMVRPEFQGGGIASEAVRAMLRKARVERRWDVIHAFPGVTNAPSNGICRKVGFTKVEDVDFEYAGRSLRCSHWVLDLRTDEAA